MLAAALGALTTAMMTATATAPVVHADDPLTDLFDAVQGDFSLGQEGFTLANADFTNGDVADGSNRPSDVLRVPIPQLDAVSHVGDVVEVRIFDLPQETIDKPVEFRILALNEAGLLTQTLQKAQRMELGVLVWGLLTH